MKYYLKQYKNKVNFKYYNDLDDYKKKIEDYQ